MICTQCEKFCFCLICQSKGVFRNPGHQLERIFIDGDKLKAFEYDVIPAHKIAVAAKYVNCH